MNHDRERRYKLIKFVTKLILSLGLSGGWLYWVTKAYTKYKVQERRIKHIETSTDEILKRMEATSHAYSMGMRKIYADRGDLKTEFWINFFSGAQEGIDIMAYAADY